MKLSGAYRFDVPRERLWRTLMDTTAVGSCIPGVRAFTPLGDDRYEIELGVKVGIVSGSYKGTLAIADVVEPESYRMTFEGSGARHGDQGHRLARARGRTRRHGAELRGRRAGDRRAGARRPASHGQRREVPDRPLLSTVCARKRRRERDAVTGDLLLERDGAVATVTLNRPEQRNAISYDMWLRLPVLFAELDADDAVRAVLLTGAGEKAFSAGADIKDFEETRSTPERARNYRQAVHDACDALNALSKPTVAAIRGYCLGGGLELALYADVRMASTDAQFGLPAAKRGIGVSHGHVDRLLRLVGPGDTAYLMLTGRMIPAERALASGVVSIVVDDNALAEEARALAEEVASLLAGVAPDPQAGDTGPARVRLGGAGARGAAAGARPCRVERGLP